MGVFDYLFKSNLSKPGNNEEYSEEFSTEMYDKVFDVSNMPPYNSYTDSGIKISEATYPVMKITYEGLLARGGAQEMQAVVGYGNNLKWEDVETFTMSKVGDHTFDVSIPIKRNGNINVVFKDSAGNWDNNAGMNYSFRNHFYQGSH